MFETYVEQNNVRNNPKSGRGRAMVYRVLSYVFIALGIICLFMWQFVPIPEGTSLPMLLLGFIPLIIFQVGLFVSAYVMRRAYLRTNPEFDYILNGNMFRIALVLNRSKRKKFLELRLSEVIAMGTVGSDSHDRFAGDRSVKKVFALTNPEEEDVIYYMYYNADDKRCLLYFEPKEEMLLALKRTLGRNIFSDK